MSDEFCTPSGSVLGMKAPTIVSSQEWEQAREQLLVAEKDVTRAQDSLAAQRRRMPWLAVDDDCFINNRGDEKLGATWSYLDLTPLGRREKWEDAPEGHPQTKPYEWWNWHDAYDGAPT